MALNLKEQIKEVFNKILQERELKLQVSELNDNVVLLESGLDSLGFAILIATLEEKLGYDPFTMMEEAVYPRTFGEFVAIYEKMNPNKQNESK